MRIPPAGNGRPSEEQMRAQGSGAYERLLPAARLSNAKIDEETVRTIATGRNRNGEAESPTVRARLCSATCGWKTPATEAEFYRALRTEEPDRRQRNILDAWATEATPEEIFRAWAEGAYTPRTLAAALHRAGLPVCKAARFLNNFDQEPAGWTRPSG